VEDELIGALIVEKALSAPLKKIASNAGQNGAVIFERVKNSAFEIGYNAATNELVNMFEVGIIDPAKVTIDTSKCSFYWKYGFNYRMYNCR